MRSLICRLALTIIALSSVGCSIKIVPQQIDGGIINKTDNSQTIVKNAVSITVGSVDAESFAYNLDKSVTSFSLLIDNGTDEAIAFDYESSFVLIDETNQQYLPLTPERVKEILSRDNYYLIPYPYVGFYYLEDYEKSVAQDAFSSNLLYYELYPQDIYTKALQGGTIIPKAKATGLIYFQIDLYGKKEMKLLVFRKGASKSSSPEFTFPFRIEK